MPSLAELIAQSKKAAEPMPQVAMPEPEAPKPALPVGKFAGLLGSSAQKKQTPVAPPPQPVFDIVIEDVPAVSAPAREITADQFNNRAMQDGIPVEEQKNFLASVQMLYDSFDEPELVSTACRSILLDLRQNEQLSALLLPEDIGQMVKFLQLHTGSVQASKISAPKKAGGRKKADALDLSSFIEGIDLG